MGDNYSYWNINTSGLDDLVKKLEDACANMDAIAKKAVNAAAPRIKSEMERRMPKSADPRLPGRRDTWRTGRHAADEVEVSRFKTSLRGSVYKVVGPSENDPHFYMKFLERGRRVYKRMPGDTRLLRPSSGTKYVGYQDARPYMQPIVDAVRGETIEILRNVLLKELEIFD